MRTRSGTTFKGGVDHRSRSHSRRGRYDRTTKASERARDQRAQLLRAIRHASSGSDEITVAALLAIVGCGRTTFYQHFDDVPSAITAACTESASELKRLLEGALQSALPRTPGDDIREVMAAWVVWCNADDGRHLGLLERFDPVRIALVVEHVVTRLHARLVAAGAAAGDFSAMRACAASGALRAVARSFHAEQQQHPLTQVDAAYDVLLRLLR
jgi:AcrR family transcriptional regulator